MFVPFFQVKMFNLIVLCNKDNVPKDKRLLNN